MQGPVAAYLDGGARLHLQHGPIDLIIGAEGAPGAREAAFAAASARFRTLLETLVGELPALRRQLAPGAPGFADPVARRMARAAMPFAAGAFVTPMIAVAGSVADEVLAAMLGATPLRRAYVNNGGDIAVSLEDDTSFSVALAAPSGRRLGTLRVTPGSGIGGVATSGAGGRSLSLGIADSVTVVARDAATADAAATLIANAVDLPGHPGIRREPACDLQPDSDLGARAVVTAVPTLAAEECDRALDRGVALAGQMHRAGQILGAALFLQGRARVLGAGFATNPNQLETAHA